MTAESISSFISENVCQTDRQTDRDRERVVQTDSRSVVVSGWRSVQTLTTADVYHIHRLHNNTSTLSLMSHCSLVFARFFSSLAFSRLCSTLMAKQLTGTSNTAGRITSENPHYCMTDSLISRVSEWANEKGLTSPSTHYRSFQRRVFPVNHLHWYWQPNQINQETEHSNNTKSHNVKSGHS